jgi:hypothetical protein
MGRDRQQKSEAGPPSGRPTCGVLVHQPREQMYYPRARVGSEKMPGITMKLSSRKYFEELEWLGAQGLKWSLDHLLGA